MERVHAAGTRRSRQRSPAAASASVSLPWNVQLLPPTTSVRARAPLVCCRAAGHPRRGCVAVRPPGSPYDGAAWSPGLRPAGCPRTLFRRHPLASGSSSRISIRTHGRLRSRRPLGVERGPGWRLGLDRVLGLANRSIELGVELLLQHHLAGEQLAQRELQLTGPAALGLVAVQPPLE
jgi:hypothetical protein